MFQVFRSRFTTGQILGQVQTTMVYDVNATRYIVACVDGRGTGFADFKKK
jgi:hypothetical protein